MKSFKIGDFENYIEIKIVEVLDFPDSTSFEGGYTFKGLLSIGSGAYQVINAEIWLTTGLLAQLYEQLKEAYETLKGKIVFTHYEGSLFVEMELKKSGQLMIEGSFQEFPSKNVKLNFEFQLDQSYLVETLKELKLIVQKYGGMRGK